MEYLVENWYFIVGLAAIMVVVAHFIQVFVKKPTSEQIKDVKEWILFAVIEAEKQFGSKTGQLKLRYVYDKFVERFGFLAHVISFETVSRLVDEALEKMEELLRDNEAVENYVGRPSKKEDK